MITIEKKFFYIKRNIEIKLNFFFLFTYTKMNVFSFNAHGLDVNLKSVNIGNTAGGECFSLLLEPAKTRPNGTASTPHPPRTMVEALVASPTLFPSFTCLFLTSLERRGKITFHPQDRTARSSSSGENTRK